MQTLKRILNSSVWRQWMVVFLAGLVVLMTTACGATQAAVPVDNISGIIKPSKSEGMYPYKDTDMDTRAADAKANRMIREANQRIQQGNDQTVGERVEEVGQSVKQAAEDMGKSTQQAVENATDKARSLVDDAVNTVDQAIPDRG